MEAIAFWWRICEFVSLWEDRSDAQNRGKIKVEMAVLRRETGWNSRRIMSNLSKLAEQFLIGFETVSDELVTISVCNWLKFQETRGQKTGKKTLKNRVDIRCKIEDIKIEDKRNKIEEADGESIPSISSYSSLPDLLSLWNNNCGNLPKILAVGREREELWAQRYSYRPDTAYWTAVIQKMAISKFCNGSGTWKATVDWLLKNDTNHQKVIEGNYDDERGQASVRRYVWPDGTITEERT